MWGYPFARLWYPVKEYPALGIAISVNALPVVIGPTEQVGEQSIPDGTDSTFPDPLIDIPMFVVGVHECATICLSASAVKTQLPVPEQTPPNHPRKTIDGSGVAVRVTDVPRGTLTAQLDPGLPPRPVKEPQVTPAPPGIATEPGCMTN